MQISKLKNFLLLILLVITSSVFCQNSEVDSLKKCLLKAKEDTNKFNVLNELSGYYRVNAKYDSSIYYIDLAQKVAENILKLNDTSLYKTATKKLSHAYNNRAMVYKNQGFYSKALEEYNVALELRKKINDFKSISGSYNNIGEVYRMQANYPEAIKNYFYSLKFKEKVNDKKGIALVYNNIGNIYSYPENYNYNLSLKYYLQSLQIRKEIGDKKGIADIYNNIGILNIAEKKFNEAIENYFKSLKLREEIKDKRGIADSYHNLAAANSKNKDFKSALNFHQQALKLREEIGDKHAIAYSLISIGNLYLKQNNTSEAKKHLSRALKLSKEMDAKNEIVNSYSTLASLDSLTKNYEDAYFNYINFDRYKDTIENEENSKSIMQYELRYEFDKKEALQKAEQEKKDALALKDKQKKNIILASVIVGLLIVLGFSFMLYKRFLLIKKQKLVIENQKHEVEKQKEIVDEKNKEILDSITYAKRLQEAILPPLKLVKKYLENSFILYKPKDIVAGDFYWFENKNDILLFAAADCTGHGVPGAMVSVVCSNALNRTVKEFNITEPGKILDKVRELVVETFEKSESEVKDGMDVSLCAFNTKTNELFWSGANNPLWLIKKNEIEITEFKPDKQPIGKTENGQLFTTQKIILNAGDTFYIFTDGYCDQFGGQNGKKFKSANFKKLLLSIQNNTLDEQSKLINNEFEQWKGLLEQVDDVCVIGVRV